MSMEPMDAIVELRAIETAVPMTKDATVAGAASKVSTATQPGVSSQTAGLQDEEERPVMSTRKRLRNMAALSGLFVSLVSMPVERVSGPDASGSDYTLHLCAECYNRRDRRSYHIVRVQVRRGIRVDVCATLVYLFQVGRLLLI